MHYTGYGYLNYYMNYVGFSPNGEILAASSANGKVYLLDIKNRKLLYVLDGEGELCFSPNGRFLAIQCFEHNVCFYDVKSGELIQRLARDEIYYITDIAFSNDGQLLIAIGYTTYIGPSVKSSALITTWEISAKYASGILPQITPVTLFDVEDAIDDKYSITPTVVLQCPGAPPQRLTIGEQGMVCTRKDSLRVRTKPGLDGEVISSISPGTTFEVIDGPECAGNNWSWWKIQLVKGVQGWVAEGGDNVDPYFLCPVD
jgi:WD40 repeat protein